ncbi:sucrose phosphorylase-like protein [Parageobacillus genomosp. 1]|uniref:Sucrose phosphorylase n=1 Tax=Parageobacillus genomosp. 1 TaxID=1295642 RepID=A0ABC9VF69_9BACL|nr:sugar phosphorylase [Parageobacillus genomosp. 1]EZP77188.1 sucrose phosphorylase-like protein [Parageobacillus genomosp. 1]
MLLEIDLEKEQNIRQKLKLLYGDQEFAVYEKIVELLQKYMDRRARPKPWVTENDVMLITYGDSIKEKGTFPLQTLKEFLLKYVKKTMTAVHILPFYPYTSDDGFSVVDYRKVNPELGDWEDIKELSNEFDLMFDAVINHISKSSEWFQGYLRGEEKYAEYFIEADPNMDYSKVVRPRTLPLLTEFDTVHGKKYIWTTFSDDQIDLNYKNPDVLLEVLDILILYVLNGARFIRLDAIGFIWKKQGTSCMHLEETHALVKLIREVIDLIAPGTILITETNVPHSDNIGYFGNGYDEAHMVYQFPLPPLTLFSFHTQNACKLLEWADRLEPTSDATTFFNFLASHDGIGLRATEGILTDEERQLLVDKTIEHGGRVSYRDNGDGTKSPYELNITYLDALTHPSEGEDIRIKRFLAAHTILLSMAGVPGIYIHSLLGSRNDYKGMEESGINRRINREKIDKDRLYTELESNTLRRNIFVQLSELIQRRRTQKAFSPQARQEVLFLDERVFSILRTNEQTGDQILVLVNVSEQNIGLKTKYAGIDLISNQPIDKTISLRPYQAMWIKTK